MGKSLKAVPDGKNPREGMLNGAIEAVIMVILLLVCCYLIAVYAPSVFRYIAQFPL